MKRRQFFINSALTAVSFSLIPKKVVSNNFPLIKPPHLQAGDGVAIISPAGATFKEDDLNIVIEAVKALKLVPKVGQYALARYGYLAGKDSERASDINQFFADDNIALILPIRGGWGSSRLLPYLDYDLIRRHPKIICGFSDITSLLLAIYAKTGLVTFHAPNGFSSWRTAQTESFRQVLFSGEKLTFRNLPDPDDANRLMQVKNRIQTITKGQAKGKLIGGNLTTLASIVGSPYVPNFTGAILFLEDIGEDIYEIDRLFNQLKLAGIFDNLAGFIFGQCSNCSADSHYGSLTLEEVIREYIQPLKIPACLGLTIGHLEIIETIPIGIEVEFDANRGTITMLESAVSKP